MNFNRVHFFGGSTVGDFRLAIFDFRFGKGPGQMDVAARACLSMDCALRKWLIFGGFLGVFEGF